MSEENKSINKAACNYVVDMVKEGKELNYNYSEVDQNLVKESFIDGANWQSQHSYSESDLKAAFAAGMDFAQDCNCGTCDYCIECKSEDAPNYEQWLSVYKPKK